MAYETIIYERKGKIAYITLNRPQSLGQKRSIFHNRFGEGVFLAQHEDFALPAPFQQIQRLFRGAGLGKGDGHHGILVISSQVTLPSHLHCRRFMRAAPPFQKLSKSFEDHDGPVNIALKVVVLSPVNALGRTLPLRHSFFRTLLGILINLNGGNQ